MFNYITSKLPYSTPTNTDNQDNLTNQEAPVEDIPIKEAPINETSIKETPAKETPVTQYDNLFKQVSNCAMGCYNTCNNKAKYNNMYDTLDGVTVNNKIETLIDYVKIGLYDTTCVITTTESETEKYSSKYNYKTIVIGRDDKYKSFNFEHQNGTATIAVEDEKYLQVHIGRDVYFEVEHKINKLIIVLDMGCNRMVMSYDDFVFTSKEEAYKAFKLIRDFVVPSQPTVAQ
jgi:hypothetical protein